MIEFINVSKKFDKYLFNNFNFTFLDNGFYIIKGRSGAGKSTILNLISGLDTDFEGDIKIDNKSIKKLNEKEKRELRLKDIGFIFQSFNLFEDDTVENNIKLVLDTLSISNKEKNYLMIDVLKKLGILHLKNSLVKNLSGGEKQRVGIARVLVKSPKIILADEPTGALDFKNSKKIFKILKSISKYVLVIVITHDEYFTKLYGNNILSLENEKIIYNENEDAHFPKSFTISNKNYLFKGEIKFRHIFTRFKNLFKYKRKSQMFLVSIISFSLFTCGLTLTLKDEISNLIISSFSSLCGENSIILEKKENSYEIEDYYGASKEDIINLYNNYNEIEEIGAYYLNNFNDFFIEENDIYLVNQFKSLVKIDNLNMNNFINYKYIKNINSINTYPLISSKLNKNEIILGLNNETMLNLTSNLRIENTFNSLGKYIEKFNPYILLKVRNDYWTYDDELIFNIKGITLTSSNEIISSHLFFNEYVLEEQMRFPSYLDFNRKNEYPWDLRKYYYFKSNDKEKLIKKISLNPLYNDFTFDSSFSKDKIALIYKIDNYLKETDIEIFNDYFEYKSYYYSTNYGYINYSSLLAGFSFPTFLSNDSSALENIIKSDLKFEDYYYINNSNYFLSGNYLINNEDKLKISSDFSNSIEGRYPDNYKEIAISKDISKKFNLKVNDSIYLSTFIDSNDDILKNNYKIVNFKITGIVNESNNIIYQNGYFSINFYRDRLNISPYYLSIQNITVFLNEKVDDDIIIKFNNEQKEFKISAPLLEIENSIDESLKIILIILNIFSIFAIAICLILLIIISYIRFTESKKESAILMILGYSSHEVFKNCFILNLLTSLIGLFFAIILMIFGNISLSFVIKKMIGGFNLFIINPKHLIYLIILSFIISFLSSIFLVFRIKKINIKKELHH